MLSQIWEVVKNIGNFLGEVVTFVIDFISDVFMVAELLAEVIADMPQYLAWMPATVSGLILSVLAIVIVYKIINRS